MSGVGWVSAGGGGGDGLSMDVGFGYLVVLGVVNGHRFKVDMGLKRAII